MIYVMLVPFSVQALEKPENHNLMILPLGHVLYKLLPLKHFEVVIHAEISPNPKYEGFGTALGSCHI